MELLHRRTHEQYKKFVKSCFSALFKRKEIFSIVRFAPYIARLFLIDLDYIRELLLPTYNNPHNKPIDPVALFRALILMTFVKEQSIKNWVDRLRDNKVLAILAGFEPGKTPGIGTFYDFQVRLFNADKKIRTKNNKRTKKFNRKPKKKLKKNQKLPPKHPMIVEKIVNRIMKYFNAPSYWGENQILLRFFFRAIVLQSAHKGLLGDVDNLSVSADGTHIKTGGSHYGIKICDCPKFVVINGKKIFNRCDCDRRFSDFDANWGWDSYREQWLFGYNFYELTAADSPYDLPLFFIQGQASRNDSVMGPIALDLFRKAFNDQFKISQFLADAIHDNMPTYKYANKIECETFIPLNDRNTGNFKYDKCDVNDQGTPVCKCGEPMIYNGYCPDRVRIKWRCPLKADKNFSVKSQCISNNYCSPSKYGRVVYTYSKHNPRLFTKTPRESEQWNKIYGKRSSSERSNKRKKRDYRIEQARVRGRQRWFLKFMLAAICQHLDAWAKTTDIDFKELCKSWQLSN